MHLKLTMLVIRNAVRLKCPSNHNNNNSLYLTVMEAYYKDCFPMTEKMILIQSVLNVAYS
jgi:hypothetical protein